MEQIPSPSLLAASFHTKGAHIMIEERITETTDVNGNVVERTIERDTGPTPVTVNTAPASGGGSGVFIMVILLLALAVGGYFFFANSGSEVRKDDAIAEAADNVGAAAEKAGNAVEKAADKLAN
jgi:predicted secreted protein